MNDPSVAAFVSSPSLLNNNVNQPVEHDSFVIGNDWTAEDVNILTESLFNFYEDDDDDAPEQVQFRKERNRILAKKTRDRKCVAFSSWKQEFLELHQEHQRLMDIVQKHDVPVQAPTPLQAKIPREVWNVCGVAVSPSSSGDHPNDRSPSDSETVSPLLLASKLPSTNNSFPNIVSPLPQVNRQTDVRTLAMLAGVPNPLFCT